MKQLNSSEMQMVSGGNDFTDVNPASGQSCVNEMVEMGGIGAIGGALGGGVGAAVGAIVGAFSAFVSSDECAAARE